MKRPSKDQEQWRPWIPRPALNFRPGFSCGNQTAVTDSALDYSKIHTRFIGFEFRCFLFPQVSVSCGIPDFRSRDGVYARLAVDFPDLPDPQAIFDINYFRRNPKPFFKFAKVGRCFLGFFVSLFVSLLVHILFF